MEDVLSRARAQIKWEEDPAYHHRHYPRSDSHVARNGRTSRNDTSYPRPRGETLAK